MKKVFIDEYLSIPLRQRIDKLVELNLDLESILSLLSNDLYEFSPEMLDETKRYVKYVIWLRDHHKERNLAFEKYKKQIKQKQQNDFVLLQNSGKEEKQKHLTNELFLAQLQKERKRIDEISNLHYEKAEIQKAPEPSNKTVNQESNPVDEILKNLTDEEIQETLSEILTQNFDLDSPEISETNLNQEQKNNQNDEFAEKKKAKEEQPILDDLKGEKNPKTLTSPTKKIEDLTFEDILTDHSTTLLGPETGQTLFDFDYLEDNGTETLNDSILLEDEELNLQNFTTDQTVKSESENQKTNLEIDDEPIFEEIEIEFAQVNDEEEQEILEIVDVLNEFNEPFVGEEELNLQNFTTNQTVKSESENQKTNSEVDDEEIFDELEIEITRVIDENGEEQEILEIVDVLNEFNEPFNEEDERDFRSLTLNQSIKSEGENQKTNPEIDATPIFEEEDAIDQISEELEPEQEVEKIKLDEHHLTDENKNQELVVEENSGDESEELIDDFEDEEDFELEQTEDSIEDESEELEDLSETNQALDFLDQLEDKYGDQTLITINAEKHDLQTGTFTLAEPTSTLKIGVHVHYQNKDYVVENIEIELDFFHHQQTILTLIDLEKQDTIRVNAKKIK